MVFRFRCRYTFGVTTIGVDLYTFVGARAPTMLSWAPPKVLWAPTTKVGTGITVQFFNPAAAGGGHKVAPLYFCDDIVATRRDRKAKLRTHLPEYLPEVVSKFGVDPI